ncbi:MAG: glutamine--fructose-6-phosphate transaminase (isomerizing) [Thermaurantimonas sp.]
MCGIVGYLGYRDAYPILIKGLKRLEYRGYDSAGVAIHDGKNIHYYKKKGKVSDLESISDASPHDGHMGIAHTRWATHGEPSDRNSHPHKSMSGNLFLIHNGIIENFHSIKEALLARGFKFNSDTDTEVLVNLIEDIQKAEDSSLEMAVRQALNQVIGAYAICVFDRRNPNEIIVAKMGSPIVIGLAPDEYFIASDATPFLEYTKKVVYLQDGEMAVVKKGSPLIIREITTNLSINPYIQQLQMDIEQIEKGGFEHFMLKEIYEQPRSIRDTLRGRLLPEQGLINMRGIDEYKEKFLNANRFIIVGCGTSWHAGLVGEYMIEDLVRTPVEVEYASEFRYRNPIITEKDVVIAISQSGETADTLAAVKLAKSMGATIFGICNVVGSSIARETHSGAYTHAGPEIGVASTKAFTAQITVLTLLALKLGYIKGTLSESRYMRLILELNTIPDKVEETLKCDPITKYLADIYKDSNNALYLGRGYNFPVALEGALKLKEISYIHAEGYPAAEMKHGPIALIDENMPVIVIAPKNDQYDKIFSNVQEVKARKGRILAIVNHDDTDIASIADHKIEVPETENIFSPIINTVPLQLLSYHIALMRGCNVDQPRNLAKSVTVE